MSGRSFHLRLTLPALFVLLFSLLGFSGGIELPAYAASTPAAANAAFAQAAGESGVPVDLLKALCYMEGRLSMHGGTPSIDGGFGCIHLIKSSRANTLDVAASLLHVSAEQLQTNLATNIRGGAAVLRDDALRLSSTHTLPTRLADWYGAVAAYSSATVRSTALMYADALYKILNTGFSASTDTGEVVTLAAQTVKPATATAAGVKGTSTVPAGCTVDSNVDYPGAIDCIVDPSIFNCNISPFPYPGCTYEDANRPTDFAINFVMIHDIEGTAQDALNVFQDHNSGVSVHYVIDSDGTIYQVIHEKDIAYHAGNFWVNQHSIGIEHAGFDATGFQWYNATEYLASAKLVAHLLQKYHLPLDHAHVVAHGTIPYPNANNINHVDPGPYWLWDYYFGLIHQQGIPFPGSSTDKHIITLKPATDKRPFNKNGTETPANFNFFYLYNGPSTASGLIPSLNGPTDVTDETNNVEPDMSYYYLAKVKDPAGSGDTLYEIWYGETNQTATNPPTFPESANLVWLAVPPGAAVEGQGVAVTLTGVNGGSVPIYGGPITNDLHLLGQAPSNAIFASTYTVVEDGSSNLWYEISYNHRQAWVQASAVTVVRGILPR